MRARNASHAQREGRACLLSPEKRKKNNACSAGSVAKALKGLGKEANCFGARLFFRSEPIRFSEEKRENSWDL